jgi:hypothetical protein
MKLSILGMSLVLSVGVLSPRVCYCADHNLTTRRKVFGNCKVYLQEAKQASTWALNIGPAKVSHDTKETKPSDELTKLGLATYTLCREYESNAAMTDEEFSRRITDLTVQKAEVLKGVSHQLKLQETLHLEPTVTVKKNKAKN